jgi:membrane associated rhomboid family serine protease
MWPRRSVIGGRFPVRDGEQQPTVSVPRVVRATGMPRAVQVPGWILLALCWAAWLWFVVEGRSMAGWGVSAAVLAAGRYETLLLTMFAHAGLLHLGMNSAVLASLAPVTVMAMGGGARGALPFFAFYLLAGLAGSLLFVAINWGGSIPAVGASGAISGLIGFVARLAGNGRLLPLFGPELGTRIWDFGKANLILIALFALPALLGGGRIMIAWEAHLGGFLFGLLAAGWFLPQRRPA